jgi:uncharacterized membrane protein
LRARLTRLTCGYLLRLGEKLHQGNLEGVHRRTGKPHWTWALSAILFVIIMWLSTAPSALTGETRASATAERFMASAHFPAVRDTVMGRCAMCHAAEPSWEGLHVAPKGVLLDTDEIIAERAHEIYLQSGRSNAMPPGNLTHMTEEERALLVTWFEEARAAR